jgi:hypothetical protein
MHNIPYINYRQGDEIKERPHDNNKLHRSRGNCKKKRIGIS